MTCCRESGYKVGEIVTVDETVVPFSGRCPIKTYTKGKTHEEGIKIYGCTEPTTHYYYSGVVYLRKEHHIVSDNGLGYDVIFL